MLYRVDPRRHPRTLSSRPCRSCRGAWQRSRGRCAWKRDKVTFGEDATKSDRRGVERIAENGWGVYAMSQNGQALRVDGRATFSRAGMAQISYPRRACPPPFRVRLPREFVPRASDDRYGRLADEPRERVWVRAARSEPEHRQAHDLPQQTPGSTSSPKAVRVGGGHLGHHAPRGVHEAALHGRVGGAFFGRRRRPSRLSPLAGCTARD